jgi:hypothetical protein
MQTHLDLKEQNIGQVLRTAIVLHALFEEAETNKNMIPSYFSQTLIQKYELDFDNKKLIEEISENLTKAKQIVTCIEDSFGVDENGKILNSEKLYPLILDGEIPKHAQIQSFNFCLIYFSNEWNDMNSLGRITNGNFENLLSGEILKKYIANNRALHLDGLVATIISEARYKTLFTTKQKPKYIHQIKYDPYVVMDNVKKTTKHEIRHVIDQIINIQGQKEFVETPAYLYSGESYSGLKLDLRNIKQKLFELQIENKHHIGLNEILREINQIRIEHLEKFIPVFEEKVNHLRTTLNKFNTLRFSNEQLSYIFSIYQSKHIISYFDQIKDLSYKNV